MELQHNCVCAIIICIFLEFTLLMESYRRMRSERGGIMFPVNLFQLTRVDDLTLFAKFEQQLSHRSERLEPKEREVNTLNEFVKNMFAVDCQLSQTISGMEHFYFSYKIPKISKEFDLLRISGDKVINIELKSESSDEKISKQLKQNRHYLKSLCKAVKLYAFRQDTNKLYVLKEDGALIEGSFVDLRDELCSQQGCFTGDIDTLFHPSDFLISPMNTPERFLNGEFFLSSHQEEIQKKIVSMSQKEGKQYFGITGDPGTGKTLLLYDLGMKLSAIGKCCIIHCGIMSEGLEYLNRQMTNIDVVPAKNMNESFRYSDYKYILVDEAHRIHLGQFLALLEKTKEERIQVIFSFDERQILSKTEKNAKIAEQIRALVGSDLYTLTNKIRTNKELASFIERFRDLHSPNRVEDYSSVRLAFAHDQAEATLLLSSFIANGYTFINYTGSSFYSSSFDCYNSYSGVNNTHTVIGQEFENVVMIVDNTFGYDENGILRGRIHPNPNYLYRQLLFQGMSRVRERLAIIIVDNQDVFQKALGIVGK